MRFTRSLVGGELFPDGRTTRRISMSDLTYLVPLYQKGVQAEETLLHETVEQEERPYLCHLVTLKDVSFDMLLTMSRPLLTHEVNKLLSSSFLKKNPGAFDVLLVSAVDGLKRGLPKFSVDKMKKSSTNYLFQWAVAYARKQLLALEAPMGIPVSRYEKYKKIAAVRHKLTDQWGREPSDEELLEYFHSGKADQRGMKGPVSRSGEPSQANKNITLELIAEQKSVESQMFDSGVSISDDNISDGVLSPHQDRMVSNSVMYEFITTCAHEFSGDAVSVFLREIDVSSDDSVSFLPVKEYQKLAKLWMNYLSDPSQKFYSYLKGVEPEGYDDIDVKATVDLISSHGASRKNSVYAPLLAYR